MTAPHGKTFIPTAMVLIRAACNFVVKHRQRIEQATGELDPTKVASISAAIDAIVVACAAFSVVETLYDPNN